MGISKIDMLICLQQRVFSHNWDPARAPQLKHSHFRICLPIMLVSVATLDRTLQGCIRLGKQATSLIILNSTTGHSQYCQCPFGHLVLERTDTGCHQAVGRTRRILVGLGLLEHTHLWCHSLRWPTDCSSFFWSSGVRTIRPVRRQYRRCSSSNKGLRA